MGHKQFLSILWSFWSLVLIAQPQQVISSAGNPFENSCGSISFTLGESITSTLSTSASILTQGFHQTKLVITDYQEVRSPDNNIVVFPNPTEEFVILKIETFQGFSYTLHDLTGRMIGKEEIIDTETELDFNTLVPSTYILKVRNKDKAIRTFKIIKH